ncbi:cytochrome P450 [Aaosphaeria arxii CBS 175.79]|uniref:Cytochrome P450 n=1 Tax=Aaosphaeria arxii CBS 175.79 TaxID=1450172 RepID=A0A6A5XKG6_9PLEO|nr:cytochrome P450 [Aaosphaeria arxii CBS 175.79]KAF2013366.1 cytochrome P450 [Aaosphaeria arxii CBS 175.79]
MDPFTIHSTPSCSSSGPSCADITAGFIRQHPYISILSSFAIICLLTTVWSTRSFNAPRNNKSKITQPPTIPYMIPGLYHGFGFLINGLAKFFTIILREYGERTPFLVRPGPMKFAIVTDAAHIRTVFQAKQMSIRQLHAQIFGKLFGAPKSALEVYTKDASHLPEEQRIEYAHISLPRRYFTGPHLNTLSERYLADLRHNLAAVHFKEGNWVAIEDMFSYFQRIITRTMIDVIFGTKFLQLYPRTIADFWEFDRNLDTFSAGTPRFMASAAYETRDRLLKNFVEWEDLMLKADGVLDDEADWNEWGLKFIRARQKAFLSMEGMNAEARASENLGILQGSNSNLLPSVFWTVFEVLRKPSLKTKVTKEIKQHLASNSNTIDISKLGTIPLLQSLHSEVLRLRLATATARTVEQTDVQLDDQYKLTKGTTAFVFSRPLALNHALWSQARPLTVSKPLKDFWAERFLTADGRFSVEGISGCWVPFGGGTHICPGRHFAKNVALSTLALLLGENEVELVDWSVLDEVLPEEEGLAMGFIRPKVDVPVRLRKRKGFIQ